MKLKLSDALALPADEAVTQKYGFIGRSGSGKSYAAMRLAELFLDDGAQIIALDWVGIWWSLRLNADGKTPGFEHVYIFGGEHADVDLRPESGALMADLVVDKHISVVLDVMHFRKAERTRFATAFAEQFFHRKKTARTACHLFIEEAQAYLPQMVRGDEARMVGVFEDIGKVGRNYGIGSSLISQRPQSINKDVLNQVEVLLAFQTNGPQERKAIAGWTAENTDAGAAMVQELPKLHVGDALVWSPQWLRVAKQIHIAERVTYDASSTPTQKAKSIRPKTLAPADLAQLGEQITATIEKAKADDPRELRKQIAELKSQLSKAAHNMQPKGQPAKTVEKPVLTEKDRQVLSTWSERLHALSASLATDTEKIVDEVRRKVSAAINTATADMVTLLTRTEQDAKKPLRTAQVERVLDKLAAIEPQRNTHAPTKAAVDRQVPVSPHVRRAVPAATASRPAHVVSSSNGGGPLPPGELATLTAALQYPGLDRKRLGILTGYKRSSRDAYIARLASKGLVELAGGSLHPTEAGAAALNGSFEPLPTGAALIDYWRARLPEGERKVLDVLIEDGEVQREHIDEMTGYKRSSRDAYLVRLKARGLVEFTGRGTVTASAELFD
jgi:hypothetical protein